MTKMTFQYGCTTPLLPPILYRSPRNAEDDYNAQRRVLHWHVMIAALQRDLSVHSVSAEIIQSNFRKFLLRKKLSIAKALHRHQMDSFVSKYLTTFL